MSTVNYWPERVMKAELRGEAVYVKEPHVLTLLVKEEKENEEEPYPTVYV